MHRSIFFSFACIDLKFCKQPPDHCCIYKSWLGSQLQGAQLSMHRFIFFNFAYIDFNLLTKLPFCFDHNFCRLGYAVSTLKYVETLRLLYYYYQACEAGEGIIGHRGIRFVCLSVVCLSSVCRLSVICLPSVCRLSVIKLLPAYGIDHNQNAHTGSSGHCKGQSRFDTDRSPIPHSPTPTQKMTPKMKIFIF